MFCHAVNNKSCTINTTMDNAEEGKNGSVSLTKGIVSKTVYLSFPESPPANCVLEPWTAVNVHLHPRPRCHCRPPLLCRLARPRLS